MHNIKRYILSLILVVPFCLHTSAQSVDEYTLKAIWMGKFTYFIDWPADSTNKLDFFTIATLSPTPLSDRLETIYNEHKIWNKPVRVMHLNTTSIDSNIQILYIPPLESEEAINNIIESTKNKNILLISDTEGYAELGVHINFFMDDKRVRFEINESAMRKSDFFISYRLLNIADIIEPLVND